MEYVFADTALAERRLGILAEVFAASTTPFIRGAVPDAPGLALDLGCGPGHTTHLLARVLGATQTVGLDTSERFIAAATKTRTDRVSFLRHDVTTVPFPVAAADVAYCRFLLTHLPEPERLLARFGTQLTPGGLLLVEEVDWIETREPALRTYLAIVEDMLASESTTLYVGPRLDRTVDVHPLVRRASTVARLAVATRDAARMFALNLATWKTRPYVARTVAAGRIARLERDLEALSRAPAGERAIEWGLRQLVLERS